MIYSAINHKIHERDDMTKSSNQVSYFVLHVAISGSAVLWLAIMSCSETATAAEMHDAWQRYKAAHNLTPRKSGAR